jgi:hypothetical protein
VNFRVSQSLYSLEHCMHNIPIPVCVFLEATHLIIVNGMCKLQIICEHMLNVLNVYLFVYIF